MDDRERLTLWLPGLELSHFEITSPRTSSYNCIAWALGNTDRVWDPDEHADEAYWPADMARDASIETLTAVFSQVGFAECDQGDLQEGLEKIAFYAVGAEFTHVARQLVDGRWTSKLGEDCDIEHELEALVSPPGRSAAWRYGEVVAFMQRPRTGDSG